MVSLHLQNSLSNWKDVVKYISAGICPGFASVKYFCCSLVCQNRLTYFLHTVKLRRAAWAIAGYSEDVCLEYNAILTAGAVYPVWGNTLQLQKKISNRKDLAESTQSGRRSRKHKLQGELERMFSNRLQKRLRRTTYVIHMHIKKKGVSSLPYPLWIG